jgi:hypothetical protein
MIEEGLLQQMIKAITRIRELEIKKKPCISESIDWARALLALNTTELTCETVEETLNVVLKYHQDTKVAKQTLAGIVG